MTAAPLVFPHDADAERSVLGGVLVDPVVFAALAMVEPGHFYSDAHARIFRAMRSLDAAAKPLDFRLLVAELNRTNELDACGGPAYVSGLTDGMPKSVNVAHYAALVVDHALRRALIGEATRLSAAAYQAEQGPTELLGQVEDRLMSLDVRVTGGVSGQDAKQLANDGTSIVERYWEMGGRGGVLSGIDELDNTTHGAKAGELVVIGARPSMGKSALMLQWAIHAAQPDPAQGHALVFSLEMTREELLWRGVSQLAKVAARILTGDDGKPTEYVRQKAMEGLCRFGDLRLVIDDTAGLTVSQARAKARRYRQQYHGLSIVFIDYLQLMGSETGARAENRNLELGAMTRGLKQLAKELAVPVVLLSQLNRGVEARADKTPGLSDLRESGAIEQDADVVILPHRPSYYDQNAPPDEALLIVAKQRNGPTEHVKVTWEAAFTIFTDRRLRPSVRTA